MSEPEPVFLRPSTCFAVATVAAVLWGVLLTTALARAMSDTLILLLAVVVVSLTFAAVALTCLSWLERNTRRRQERVMGDLAGLAALVVKAVTTSPAASEPSGNGNAGGLDPAAIEHVQHLSRRLRDGGET